MRADQGVQGLIARPGSRRAFLQGAVLVVGGGMVAGIAHALTSAAPAVRARRIEPRGILSGYAYQPHLDAFQRMAALFKRETGSTIVVQPQPAPGANQLLAALAAGTPPDIACVLASNVPTLAVRKAILSLNNSVYAANHIVVARDFVGDAVTAFSHGGTIYGVPLESDGGLGSVVNVPVDEVRRLGLTHAYPPTNGKFYFDSFEQLFTLARRLEFKADDGSVIRWGLCGAGWDDICYLSIMLTMGTPPFDPQSGRFAFTTHAGIEAIRLHAEIPVARGLEKDWPAATTSVDVALNGEAALAIGSGGPAGAAPDRYQLAGVPRVNGRDPVIAGTGNGWGLIGPARAPHPNLQTAFLRMAATRAGQYQYDLTYGGVVVVAWKDILFHDTSRFGPSPQHSVGLSLIPLFQRIMSGTRYIGDVGYYPQIQQAIKSACRAVRQRRITAKQAALQIQAQAEAQYVQYSIDLLNV